MTSNQPPTSSKELRAVLDKIIQEECTPIVEHGLYAGNILTHKAVNKIIAVVENNITKATEALLERAIAELPEPITESVEFDPPKDNIFKIYKDGMAARAYNLALKDVHTRLTTLRKEG